MTCQEGFLFHVNRGHGWVRHLDNRSRWQGERSVPQGWFGRQLENIGETIANFRQWAGEVEGQVQHREGPLKDISLGLILVLVLRGWRAIVLFMLAGLIIALCVTAIKPKSYSASMRVTPALASESGGNNLGSLGGVAAIAGLKLGGNQQQTFTEMQSLLHSNRLASLLLHDREFSRTLFPPKEWTYENGQWVFHGRRSWSQILKAKFMGLFGIHPDMGPNVEGVLGFLTDHVKILASSTGGASLIGGGGDSIVSVSATGPTPEYPVMLLQKALNGADNILKTERRSRLEAHINYLEEKLNQATVADYRASLIATLADEQKQLITVNYGGYYSFFVLDDAIVSRTPVSPAPILNVAIGLLAGFFFGAFTVIARAFLPGQSGS